jgi:diketogulonate reductase-like aldo/keto reductase
MRTSHLDFLQVCLSLTLALLPTVVVYVSSLQFYWQDYSNKGYMTALRYLQDLQAEGLITTLGIVNFDAIRTDEICTQLGPGAIVSNQVQVCTRISSRVRRAR